MEQILEDYMQLAFDPIYVFLISGYSNSICENRSPVNTESEMTGSQDEESTPVENESSMESDPESASEPNENKSTEESSTDNTVSDVPEEISVQSLEEAVQEIDAKGEASSTNRVEYVDAKGTPINGAPATIAYGNISEHKALSIDGRHFDFLSAKVMEKTVCTSENITECFIIVPMV